MSVDPLDDRPRIPLFTGLLGGAILTFLFLIVAIAEIGWAVHVPIHVFVLPLALAGSCLVTRWGARFHFRRSGLVTLAVGAILILLVAASAFISRAFFDVSFDGQGYHQEGVYQLAHAWNTLFTRYISPISIDQNVKLIHFPKGAWIIGAAMYRLTGQIESAKFANLLLICAAFCVALPVFVGLNKRLSAWPVAMAALVAANPVAVCQVFTFYLDGQMASLLACLAALCYLSIAEGNPWIDLLIFETAVLIIQLKFTGVVYAAVFLAGFILLRAWKKRPLRRQVYVAILALELGTLVFGMNPYVFNFFENGHPFYPLFGHGDFARIILAPNTPPAFLSSSPAKNLAESMFSRSRDWPPGNTLKAPWQVDASEWAVFEEPDVLVGGFGPLFPAALVLALILLGLSFLGPLLPGSSLPGVGVFASRATGAVAAFAILILVGSVLPVSGCWWARYAPQVWLVPLVALAALGCAGEMEGYSLPSPVGRGCPPADGRVRGHFIDFGHGSAMLRRLSWLVLLILLVDVGGIAVVNFRANLAATRETKESLDDLRSHAPFKVSFGYFRSNRFRLQEAGIPFVEDEMHLNCDPTVKENDDLCIGH